MKIPKKQITDVCVKTAAQLCVVSSMCPTTYTPKKPTTIKNISKILINIYITKSRAYHNIDLLIIVL